MINRTAETPLVYRTRDRDPNEVDLAVLHQTGTGPLSDSAALRVRAHALVLDDGSALRLHPWLARMRFGSGPVGNARGVNVEIRANLPGRYAAGSPCWWRPAPPKSWAGTRAEWVAEWDRRCPPEREVQRDQVLAVRALLRELRDALPALRYICPHRTLQAAKGGCCGPDLWREVGEWAIAELGLELLPTTPGGLDLPVDWRRAPTIADPERPRPADLRDYRGPLDVS